MGDVYRTIRAAAVQAGSVFLDREGSTAKACALVREAGANGAELVAFPEGFIPAHPGWFHFHSVSDALVGGLGVELFKNAVEIPGPEIARLGRAARDAGAHVVIGVCERIPGTDGTLFNTQAYIGPDGELVGKHQKLMPTAGERLVHTGGYGDTFGAFATGFGPASALICGENSNPLAIFALAAQHTRVHVMSWPHHLAPSSRPLRDRAGLASQAFATMAKCHVVSACGAIAPDMIERVEPGPEGEAFLRDPDATGGSVIVAPSGRILAGPLGPEEGILYADLDLEAAVQAKLRQDYAGHYNRADVFQLRVSTAAPRIYEAVDEDGAAGPGG